MGKLTVKLAFSGIRRRGSQSVLSVVVVAVSTGALTIALAIGTIADRPFDRTFEATNGAHLTVTSLPGGDPLGALARLPGVVGSTGVRPLVFSGFTLAGKRYGLRLVGVGRVPGSVATPVVVSGSWPRDGEIMLERSFAEFHRLGVGSTLVTPRVRLAVSGVAVVASGQGYPRSQPGLGFASESTLARVDPERDGWGQFLGLRITEPKEPGSVRDAVVRIVGSAAGLDTWLDERAAATEELRTVTVILSLFGVLLLLAAGAVLATLVGGRVLAQRREIGVLKATGLTPGQVARVLVTEQLALATVGVVIGIGAGYLCTPFYVSQSASLLGATETPALDAGRGFLVATVVLALVAVFTYAPGLRAARRPTAESLVTGRTGGSHRSRFGRFVAGAGASVPIAVGARGSFVHRGRTLLTALSLALTVASVVATLGMEASLVVATNPGVAPLAAGGETPMFDPVDDDAGEAGRLRPVVYSLDGMLLFVGLVNLVATLLLTTRERVRDLGLLKAVGLTPRQVTASLVSEQIVIAVIAGLAGIPLGLGLFRLGIGLAGSADEFAYPSWWSLLLLIPGVVALVALFATPIARRAASLSVAKALRFN